MTTIKFKAKKSFKYGGKVYEVGDEWKPAGKKYDAQIKEHLVYTVEIVKRPVRRRKKANVTSSK